MNATKLLRDLLIERDGKMCFDPAAWESVRIHARNTNVFWNLIERAAQSYHLSDEETAKILAVAMFDANAELANRLQE